MALANLGLRFLLEVAGVAALAYAGFHLAGDGVSRLLAAVGAPLLLVLLWAAVVAPKAASGLAQPHKDVLGTVLLLGAAGALGAAGRPLLAAVLAAVVLDNAVLLLTLDEDVRVALAEVAR
jgi:hypothetical protein